MELGNSTVSKCVSYSDYTDVFLLNFRFRPSNIKHGVNEE